MSLLSKYLNMPKYAYEKNHLTDMVLYDWNKYGPTFRYLLIDGLPYIDFQRVIDPWDAVECGLVSGVANLNGFENGACLSHTIGM